MKLGDLLVKLGLDLSDYSRGLAKAQADTDSFGKNLGSVTGEAKEKIGEFAQATVTRIAAVVAAYAGVSAILGQVKGSIDGLDAIDELSERLAVNGDLLQKYAYQAHFYGVSLDEVGGAVKKLGLNMTEAAGGGKQQADLFRTLGVSVVDATGKVRDVDAVMADVMEKFAGMEDGAGKTALAVDLFGKSGANLNAWLSSGVDGLKQATEEAVRFGVIVPEAATKAAGEFNDNLDRIAMVARGTFNQVNAAALPAMNAFLEAIIEASTETDSLNQSSQRLAKDGTLGEWAKNTARVLAFIVDAGQGVYRTFELIGKGIGAAAAQAVLLAQGEFRAATNVGDAFLSDVDDILNRQMFSQTLEARLAALPSGGGAGGGGGTGTKTRAPLRQKGESGRESEAERIIKSLREQVAVQDAATQSTRELTEGERAYAKFLEDLRIGKDASLKQSKAQITALYQEVIAGEKAAKSRSEYLAAREKEWSAIEKGTDALRDSMNAAHMEGQAIGLAKDQVEQLEAARLAEQAAAKLSKAAIYDLLPGYEAEAAALREQAALLNDLASQKLVNDERQRIAERAAETSKEWEKVADQLNQSLTDSLFRAFEDGESFGKSFLNGLKNLAKTTLLRIPIQYIQSGVMSAFGLGGSGQGSGGSTLQSASDLYGLYDKLKNGYGLVSSWFGGAGGTATGAMFGGTGALAGGLFGAGTGASIFGSGAAGVAYGANAGLGLYGTGTALSLSGGTAGLSATAGSAGAVGGAGLSGAMAAVPVAGWIAAGMAMADSMFSKGWDAQKVDFTGFGKVTGSATMAFDKLLRGMGMSDRLANIISGASIHAALFGRKKPEVQASGIVGDFTADGFDGQAYTDWRAKGGLFRRSKSWTDYASLDEGQSATLHGAVRGALGFYRNLDRLAGGAGMAEREGSFSYRVRADLRGEGALDKLLVDMSNALGQHVLPQLVEFQREGESIADTAQRLTDVFAATNTVASVLGKTTEAAFGALGLATAKVRQDLVDVAGGIESLGGKVATYYDLYYTGEEKLARLQSQMGDSFRDLGVTMPTSLQGFRALVESLDLTSASGQEMFSTLLDLAPAFAQMTEGLGQAAVAMEAFGKQVREFQQSLGLSDLSTLTPEQKYAEARRRYEETSAAARDGDAEAQASWTQVAQAFLEASRAFYASGGQYAADYAAVQGFRPNGSHANGLAYVPFDGYLAELHQGERVLTRAESEAYRQPNWSQYGQGASAALIAEVKTLRAELVAMREAVGQAEAVKETQAAARHEETMAAQTRLVRLQQDLLNK
ncbi:hypothetical protein MNJPNG_06390 [Cupriavidus oxalaticus]|uniref:hypothetical protein n=1 Tax=Cupriavidus oxalaticus TaxID=96344 RepID=UPI003F740329